MTEELSARLMDEIEDCPDPDAVLVQSGTNNLLFGYMFFPAIFTTMMQRLRLSYPQTPLIICSLTPMPIVATAGDRAGEPGTGTGRRCH